MQGHGAAFTAIAAALAVLGGAVDAVASNYIYSLRGTPSQNIWRIDTLTNTETVVFSGYAGGSAATLAQCPDGRIYYVINAANPSVYAWDPAVPATAPAALPNPLGAAVPASFRLACSGAGVLYYMPDSGVLYTVDLTTGLATAGPTVTGLGSGGDMAFDPAGALYVLNSSRQLFTAPLGGGAATSVGTLSGITNATLGLAFNLAGAAYVQVQNPPELRAFTLPSIATTFVSALSGGTAATGDLASTLLQSPTLTKQFAPATIFTGGTSTLTITLANSNSAAALRGAAVTDTYPAGVVTAASPPASTTCGGTVSTTAGSVSLVDGTIPAGGTCTVTVTVTAAAASTYVNTIPAGGLSTIQANNDAAATATLTVSGTANLGITKTDGSGTAIPGSTVTYAIAATNAGPDAVVGATVADTFPAALTGVTWTCAAAGGATCPAGGSGNINAVVNLPVGGTATFTATGTLAPTATGTLSNTATITPPGGVTDPDGANNTATDTDTLTPQANLAISKTDGVTTVVAGTSLSYTIVASNAGPSTVTGATVADTFPAAFTGATWTCTAAGGASCPANGVGNLSAVVNLPVGGTASFTATGTVAPTATGTLANTVTITAPGGVTDSVPGNNSATDTDTIEVQADLAVTKSGTPNPFAPGSPLTYLVSVTNTGPSDVTGARVQDALPGPLAAFTWSCIGAGGGTCATVSGAGNIDVQVTMPVGATVTFTISGVVPPGTVGPLVNTATVTPPAGTTDPVPGNNTAVDTNPTSVDLAISKASAPNPYVPGQTLTYTMVVSNLGPGNAVGARVQDVLPGPLSAFTWTCAPTGGGVCTTPGGTGNIDALVDLAAATSVTFVVTGTVPSATTGVLVNTATVTAPAGITDPVPGNNSASDASPTSIVADLSIAKASTPNPYVPGLALTYTLVVANAGPSDVTDARLQDVLPAPVSGFSWTCVPAAGAACGTASGAGNLDLLMSLPAGATATVTVTGVVPPGTNGAIVNTATITPPATVTDPVPGNNTASDANASNLVADVSITKTSTPNPYLAGSPLTYTVVVANAGPSSAAGARVQDVLPAPLSGFTWTCAPSGGGVCGTAAGSGDIDALVTLPPGTSVTFMIAGVVPPGTTMQLVNIATVTPPAGTTDPTPGNQVATNVNNAAATGQPVGAELYLQQTFPPTTSAGAAISFTYTSTNRGPSDAVDLIIDAMIPAGTTFVSATPGAGGVVSLVSGMWVVTWPGITPPGAARTVTLVLQVDAAASPGAIVASWVMTSSQTPDPYHFNDMVDSYVFVGGAGGTADLVLQGIVTGGGITGQSVPAEVGQPASIRLRVTNQGAVPATGQYALVLDEIGALRVTSATTSQGWLAISGPTSGTWDTGIVTPGQFVDLSLGVAMQTATAARLLVMRVSGTPADPNARNDFLELDLDGIAAAPQGGREVAVGPVDDTPGADIVTAAGPGETPQLRIFSSAGTPVGTPYYAFPRDFVGGVRLASCDVDGDGRHEIIAAQASAGSDVRVLRYAGGLFTNVVTFSPFESSFTGGVSVACADLDGDGRAEIAVGAGTGHVPDVRVFSVAGGSATLSASFTAYEGTFTGGVRVAAARYLGGVVAPFQIVTTPGPGRAVDLKAWSVAGGSATLVAQAAVASGGGAYTALGDANNDSQLDLAIMPDAGTPTLLTLVSLAAGQTIGTLSPGSLGFRGGMRLSIGPLGGGPGVNEIVAVDGAGGVPRVQVFQLFPSGAALQRLGFLALEVP